MKSPESRARPSLRAALPLLTALMLIASNAAHPADLFPRAQKRLDAYFDKLQGGGLVSGSIAISERGVMRYQRSVGFATIDNGVPQPADAGTRYRIGPVSRIFTAALTFKVAESATLTLDNKVAEFFPDVPNATLVSYRDVLMQRSGLTEDSNYLLLGYMLEKVYDKPYANIVAQRIAAKLGLVRTYYKGTGGSTTLESISYHWAPDGWSAEAVTDTQMVGGAGGLVSNANDLVIFMDALIAGRVVSQQSFATMRGEDDNPAIGLRSVTIGDIAAFGERGAVESFNAFVYHFPAQKVTLAWTSNASRLPLDEILGEVTSLVFDKRRKTK
jgi:CubicO group peptidase (beta-lactamase class C family)